MNQSAHCRPLHRKYPPASTGSTLSPSRMGRDGTAGGPGRISLGPSFLRPPGPSPCMLCPAYGATLQSQCRRESRSRPREWDGVRYAAFQPVGGARGRHASGAGRRWHAQDERVLRRGAAQLDRDETSQAVRIDRQLLAAATGNAHPRQPHVRCCLRAVAARRVQPRRRQNSAARTQGALCAALGMRLSSEARGQPQQGASHFEKFDRTRSNIASTVLSDPATPRGLDWPALNDEPTPATSWRCALHRTLTDAEGARSALARQALTRARRTGLNRLVSGSHAPALEHWALPLAGRLQGRFKRDHTGVLPELVCVLLETAVRADAHLE